MVRCGPTRRAAHVRSLGQVIPFAPGDTAAWYRYGVGITVTGAGVSKWADQSGATHDLVQATDAARPSLQSDNSILFDGTAQFLKASAFTLNQPETLYFLFKQISWTAADYFIDGNGLDGGSINQNLASPKIRIFAGNLDANFTAVLGMTIGAYGIVTVVFNGASSVLQINAGASASGNAGANNMGGLTLGCPGTAVGNFGNIQVKELIVFPAAHTASTRANIINYLALLGGLSI